MQPPAKVLTLAQKHGMCTVMHRPVISPAKVPIKESLLLAANLNNIPPVSSKIVSSLSWITYHSSR